MMAAAPRIVAELGRPETPDEMAARKAESSRIYRSSQTTRNLIAALLVTLAVVAVIVFAVPRGTPPPPDPIDVTAVAASVESSLGRAVVAPDVPETWIVNQAEVAGDAPAAWTIVYVPAEDEGFLRIAQGFDADAAWPARELNGANVGDSVTIDGISWDRYDIPDPSKAGNVSTALSTQAGTDIVLIAGTANDDAMMAAAASVAESVRTLREAAQ